MFRIALALVALAGFASPALSAASSEGGALQWAADVPLEDCGGVPCVDARVGNRAAGKVLIDTGNAVSTVEAGETAKPSAHETANVDIGGAMLRDVSFAKEPLGSLADKGTSPRVVATLAYTAFKDRILQLDFVEDRVRISPVLTYPVVCDQPCAPLRAATFGTKGPPVLVTNGFSVNSHAIAAQVDTVFTGSVLIYSNAIAKLGLADTAATQRAEDFPYTDGGVRMRVAKGVGDIVFAGAPIAMHAALYFPLPGVHEPDALFEATVGLDLMRNAIVTLDLHDMTLAIAPYS